VAHEVVEVAELKRMGLDITKGVIVENVDQVYAAHLKAAKVEIELAMAMGDVAHVQERLPAFGSWTEDPLVPPELEGAYEELCAEVQRIVVAARHSGPEEGQVPDGGQMLEQMRGETLTEAERAAADFVLGWAKSYQVIREASWGKLLRVTTPQVEEQFYTVVRDPEPWVIFHEPVRFVVTVRAAQGSCRAGHEVGDRWAFAWCSPAGLCGSAYHTMYPVLHGLTLTSGRYEGPAAEERLVSCPDEGWITFCIERHRWTPEMWDEEGVRREAGGHEPSQGVSIGEGVDR
jgi:uncharacterized repeat protein (TIGR04076 family)